MPKKSVKKKSVDCRIRQRPVTRKIPVAQKNVIEEKLLEIKKSIAKERYISFPDLY